MTQIRLIPPPEVVLHKETIVSEAVPRIGDSIHLRVPNTKRAIKRFKVTHVDWYEVPFPGEGFTVELRLSAYESGI